MSIYDVINGALFKKPVDQVTIETYHVPFLINKWYSFYDEDCIELSNILNKLGYQFDDKQDSFKFFNCLISKLPTRRINYIKKVKEKKVKEEDEERIKVLAKRYEISTREVRQMIEKLEKVDT